jgi:hypothetical protein
MSETSSSLPLTIAIQHVRGRESDDPLISGAGSDPLDGGSDRDIAISTGDRVDHIIGGVPEAMTITASGVGRDGVGTIDYIALIQFANGTFPQPPFSIKRRKSNARYWSRWLAGSTIAALSLANAAAAQFPFEGNWAGGPAICSAPFRFTDNSYTPPHGKEVKIISVTQKGNDFVLHFRDYQISLLNVTPPTMRWSSLASGTFDLHKCPR